jgi:hypothetical protein
MLTKRKVIDRAQRDLSIPDSINSDSAGDIH